MILKPLPGLCDMYIPFFRSTDRSPLAKLAHADMAQRESPESDHYFEKCAQEITLLYWKGLSGRQWIMMGRRVVRPDLSHDHWHPEGLENDGAQVRKMSEALVGDLFGPSADRRRAISSPGSFFWTGSVMLCPLLHCVCLQAFSPDSTGTLQGLGLFR